MINNLVHVQSRFGKNKHFKTVTNKNQSDICTYVICNIENNFLEMYVFTQYPLPPPPHREHFIVDFRFLFFDFLCYYPFPILFYIILVKQM